jgi:hypothetical protein
MEQGKMQNAKGFTLIFSEPCIIILKCFVHK